MSIFRNKILIKIVASLCVVLTIINMGIPSTAYAEDPLSEYGGILIVPVTNLLVSVCDGIIGILHETIQYQDITLIQISGEPNWWTNFGMTATAILITTLLILVAAAFIGPAVAAAAGVWAKIVVGAKVALAIGAVQLVTVNLVGIEGGIVGTGTFVAEKLGNWFSGTLYMPVYTITPRYIFSNQILLFDINFFNPMPSETIEYKVYTYPDGYDRVEAYYDTQENIEKDENWSDGITIDSDKLIDGSENQITSKLNEYKNMKIINELKVIDASKEYSLVKIYENMDTQILSFLDVIINQVDYKLEELGESKIVRTEENIHINWRLDEPGTDGNLYNTVKLDISCGDTEESKHIVILISAIVDKAEAPKEQTIDSSATQLKGVVGEWYFTLRNLALLILLLILVYIGIRIVIGSTAGQKAKYKERIKDWIVAVCLIFVMHYIMVFAVELVERITELLNSAKIESGVLECIPLKAEHMKSLNELQEEVDSPEYAALEQLGTIDTETNELTWTTDIMGKFRIMTQAVDEGTVKWVGYAMCYMVLVIFTVFFTWTYLKRVVYMAFLTLIAPLVAMTYPLDKINDGQAQAFNMWLKEYIFNLLIQPMHLLLYTILVSSAYKLAATNAIYAIVSLGFMVPAEQLVRKFFGFTKAQTAGALGGAAGAALAYTGLQKVMNFTKKVAGKEEKEKNSKDKDIKFAGEGVNARETVADSFIKKDSNSGSNGDASSAEETNSGGNANVNMVDRPETEQGEPQQGDPQQGDPQQGDPQQGDPQQGDPQQGDPQQGDPQQGDPQQDNPQQDNPDQPEQSNDTSKGKKKDEKIKGSVLRGVKGIAGNYFRQLGAKAEKRIKKQRPIRALARGVGGIYGGAIMGMAGAALGVASGDPSKAMQYTTAGAVGGYAAGKAVGGKAIDVLGVDAGKLMEEIEESFYQSPEGQLYKAKKLEGAVRKMSKDENNISELRQYCPELSRGQASNVVLGGEIGRRCYESGFKDMEDIATVYEATKRGYSVDEAIAGLKFSSYLPSKLKELGDEERVDMINRWTEDYKEMKESDPEKYKDLDPVEAATRSLGLAEAIGKIKSGLTEAE